MKTLVVLSALVCFALAAPALPGDGNAGLEVLGTGIPEPIKREKRSPQDTILFPQTGAQIGFDGQPLEFNAEVGGPTVSARSHFGFKQSPIVVKKKTGYHVYRDSNEERAAADPKESCGKQLRVKVCDENIAAKASDLKRSTKEENVALHQDDVESSIQIAKEAVESLQRDIDNIESDTSAKNAQWKHRESSDKDMHVAHDTLSNAQKQLGNLESMNMHATTFKEADFGHGKSEEVRLAQWKEALENIQKNVEIVKNIEDSFRSADNQLLASEAIDTTKMMRSHGHDDKGSSTVISSQNRHNHNEKIKEHNLVTKIGHHHSTIAHENHNHEMKSAASENRETKTLLQMNHNLRTSEKASETMLKTTEDKATALRTSENKILLDTSMNHQSEKKINSEIEQGKMTTEESKVHSESLIKNTGISSLDKHKHDKNAWENIEHKDSLLDATEHEHTSHNIENNLHESNTINKMKSADPFDDINKDEDNNKKPEVSLKTDMRLTDNLELGSDAHMKITHETEHNFDTLNQGKSVETHKDMLLDQSRHSHLKSSVHHHPLVGQMHYHHGLQPMYNHHMHNQHMHLGAGHPTHVSNVHLNTIVSGKSSDIDTEMVTTNQESMKDPMAKSASENMLQWKHHTDAARSSYGPALGGGGLNLNSGAGINWNGALGAAGGQSGAVGLFPNAKIGGCAVPLLLSCSPSVVHGSLAKTHSSYSAPAYRADDFNFKKKRDIFKTKQIPENKIKRTTVITKTERSENKF